MPKKVEPTSKSNALPWFTAYYCAGCKLAKRCSPGSKLQICCLLANILSELSTREERR